jgi:hypothetical protein
MNNKLPWEAYFYGTIEKRTIRDAERHTVNVYDADNAEFIVTAVNAYEANQAEIKQLVTTTENLLSDNRDLCTKIQRLQEKLNDKCRLCNVSMLNEELELARESGEEEIAQLKANKDFCGMKQELGDLQKCYDVTNRSWKELAQENERLKQREDEAISALDEISHLRVENEQLKAQAVQCREALTEIFVLLEEHEPDWYLRKHYNLIGRALSDTPTDDHNPADEFGPVNLNSVKPDKLVIPHNPADVVALKQAKEALKPLLKLAVLVNNEKYAKGEYEGAGVAMGWVDKAKEALAAIDEIGGREDV